MMGATRSNRGRWIALGTVAVGIAALLAAAYRMDRTPNEPAGRDSGRTARARSIRDESPGGADPIQERSLSWRHDWVPATVWALRERALGDMRQLRDAALAHLAKEGRWPESMNELQRALVAERRRHSPRAAFVDIFLPWYDPWGHSYRLSAKDGCLEVQCLGAYGNEGGRGVAADFVWKEPAPRGGLSR